MGISKSAKGTLLQGVAATPLVSGIEGPVRTTSSKEGDLSAGRAFIEKSKSTKASSEKEERTSQVLSLSLSLGGLSKALTNDEPGSKVHKLAAKVLDGLDEALPSMEALAPDRVDENAVDKLVESLKGFREAVPSYLATLKMGMSAAQAKEKHTKFGQLARLHGMLLEILGFAEAATRPPTELREHALEQAASLVTVGFLPARVTFQAAMTIERIATSSALSPKEVAETLRWFTGWKSDVGFQNPERFYEVVKAQLEAGNTNAVKGTPFINPWQVTDRLLDSLRFLKHVAKEVNPGSKEAFIQALKDSQEVRTSESHPLGVAFVPTSTKGQLGLTLAPGKKQPSLYGYVWQRDLDTDLSTLTDVHGINAIVPLVEDHELESLSITDLVKKAKSHGLEVKRLPIMDVHTPEIDEALEITEWMAKKLESGKNVLTHCKGGLGRAGTIAACTLVRLGTPPAVAIAQVREARPGALETRDQERFVMAFPEYLE